MLPELQPLNKKNTSMEKAQKINWLERSVEERFAEVERLRREVWGEDYEKKFSFQKIIRIFHKGKLVKVIDARKNNIVNDK